MGTVIKFLLYCMKNLNISIYFFRFLIKTELSRKREKIIQNLNTQFLKKKVVQMWV